MSAMAVRKYTLVRVSIMLNILFLFYLFMHIFTPYNKRSQTPILIHENLTQTSVAYFSDISEGNESENSVPAQPLISLQERYYPEFNLCSAPRLTPKAALVGNYWVLYNYMAAAEQPACNASITYTTHADYTFLHNLSPLADRWRGPISVAIYAPGDDLNATLVAMAFLRACRPLVAQLVSFHVFFPTSHMPQSIPKVEDVMAEAPSCSYPPPSPRHPAYKILHNLTYPVNVARNIARFGAATYFILASDIELYPSLNLISSFLAMMESKEKVISRNRKAQLNGQRRVYVLPIFEVKTGLRPPATKMSLVKLLKKGAAVPFHKYVCPQCHMVPNLKSWAMQVSF